MSENLEVIKINTDSWKTEIQKQPEFEIFNLVNEDDPVLLEELKPFDFANPPVDPVRFASSLVETCKRNRGLGLSANQCGFQHRVFVMGTGEDYVAFFNPEVTWVSDENIKMEEGCLSFPDLFLNIERPIAIAVKYQDFNGTVKTTNFAGLTARCFLHELDHMDGIVYTMHMKPLALQMANKKRMKLVKQRTKLKKVLLQKTKKLSNSFV